MRKFIKISFSLFLGLLLFNSCSDILEATPEDVLLTDDFNGANKLDARAALFGVLAQMQEVIGKNIILGELRADLVNVNSNSVDELRQLNSHTINPNNSYADASTLFSIINNCNFALASIDTTAYNKLLLDDYASILRIRTWAQFQILINYGKLPYITKPIVTNQDLKENYPLLSFNEALDTLIQNLQSIEGVANVTKYENSLGFNVFNMIPDQNILLGDLHLWKGNYILAATNYKAFLDKNVLAAGSLYNLTTAYNVSTTLTSATYNTSSKWLNIFGTSIASNEVINYVAFSDQYRQPNSSYSVLTTQIKPSNLAILNWSVEYKGYLGKPYAFGDNRVFGDQSYSGIGDLARITKYQYAYLTWNRAAKIYLRYAEAINYAGYPDQALVIVNGIFNNPDVLPQNAPIFTNPETFLNFNKTQYYTVNATTLIPTAGNLGIRGRVGMAPVSVASNLSANEKIQAVGALILKEDGLELAFEGNRWEDLLRFSKRNNDPSIIANAVFSKFATAGDTGTGNTVKQKLMNPDNWYLPLTIPANFIPTN